MPFRTNAYKEQLTTGSINSTSRTRGRAHQLHALRPRELLLQVFQPRKLPPTGQHMQRRTRTEKRQGHPHRGEEILHLETEVGMTFVFRNEFLFLK